MKNLIKEYKLKAIEAFKKVRSLEKEISKNNQTHTPTTLMECIVKLEQNRIVHKCYIDFIHEFETLEENRGEDGS
jgi:hypothetical protein